MFNSYVSLPEGNPGVPLYKSLGDSNAPGDLAPGTGGFGECPKQLGRFR